MKLTCNRKELLRAMTAISGVSPVKSPKAILTSVKFVVDEDGVASLLATDLEIAVRRRVLGIVKDSGPGAVILPAARINEILTKSGDLEIYLETDGDILHVRTASAKFRLPSEDPSLFPEMPAFDFAAYHVVGAAGLRTMIRRTLFACDAESTRYALGGCLWEFAEDSLSLIATDGRRLAKATSPAEAEGGAEPPPGSPVVPIKASKVIDRACEDEELSIHVGWAGGKPGAAPNALMVRTSDDSTVIYSRLVEGRFPRYADVFPSETPTRIALDVSVLREAVEQAAIVTSSESKGVDFLFGPGKLTLSSQAADVGSSIVDMATEYEGPEIGITFDPDYLSQALKTIGDDEMFAVNLLDHRNAAVFDCNSDYRYVVMPLTRDR